MQGLLVALIVIACTVYAAWTLMPSAWRRGVAQRLQHIHWPGPVARYLKRTASAPAGCGCDAGCDAARPPAAAQPIRIHRRPKA
ncbi:MAG TPA: DUF6587 family protein [Rhizobacter sp.]